MADLFNFAEVKENVGGGNSQKYIYPGIRHNVVIKNIREDKTPGGTSFIELELYTKDGGPENSTKFTLYTTEKAIAKTMERIKHIATKVVTEAEINAAKSVEDLRDLLKGKRLRMRFTGEEYENKAGEIKEKATIPFSYPFAEAIEEGAESPVIADEDTQLKPIDKNNQYDFKKFVKEAESTPTEEVAPKKVAW